MELSVPLRLLAVVALVAANGFFVAAEFALVSARRTRIRTMVEEGDRLARQVQAAQSNLDLAVSGTQLGITLASLGLGWIGEPAVATVIESMFENLSIDAGPIAVHSTAIVIAFLLITYLHIVLGELAPKTVALERPEAVSRWDAPPLRVFNRLAAPGIWLLNGSASLLLRPFGFGTPGSEQRVHSPDEIAMLVRQSFEVGIVEEDEEAMIQGVFDLTRTHVREVMTPRPDIVGVPADASIETIARTAAESGFSRLPVWEGTVDRILGVIVVKDLLPWIVDREREAPGAKELMREAMFVPDTKPVDDLMAELRLRKVHMAIVVDEFGGTDGIVTLEDLVEEIVGEIYDEHDAPESEPEEDADGAVLLDGGYSFGDLLERFELKPDEEAVDGDEYDTVAGFIISRLGRIPDAGDQVRLGSSLLEVVEVSERRITRVALRDAAAREPVRGEPE